jgi:hypothetical protein
METGRIRLLLQYQEGIEIRAALVLEHGESVAAAGARA